MINLFEQYSASTELLYTTLISAGIRNRTVIIEDNGFIPEDFDTPYRFFAKNPKQQIKPLFFNEVCIPDYWEIAGDNNMAQVLDESRVKRAHIKYSASGIRLVKQVEWLDSAGRIRTIDHYDQYGKKYAESTYNIAGERVFIRYFNHVGKLIYYINFVTNNVILNIDDKVHLFESYDAFMLYYYYAAQIHNEILLMNSLGFTLSSTFNLSTQTKKFVVWQEHIKEQIPGNMKQILEDNKRDYILLVPDKKEHEKIQSALPNNQRIRPFGYMIETKQQNDAQDILIMTNSDQLIQIEQWINAFPDVTIHIAALTEMSSALMGLGKHGNVRLYPNVKVHNIEALFERSGFYLDINKGNEIVNAVRTAFNHSLLIYANDTVAHNKAFTSHYFNEESLDSTINEVREAMESHQYRQALLYKQRCHANIVSAQVIKEAIK
ncbi:accessory Sec system glycosylation chaperone GtfB [Macrococcus capreoli]|uniref:accessory Sec system glycosylation chaperone GtfB n=1 Tax=Macrococcus capreoli TaxID=2982690 RepID=UPI003EE5D537